MIAAFVDIPPVSVENNSRFCSKLSNRYPAYLRVISGHLYNNRSCTHIGIRIALGTKFKAVICNTCNRKPRDIRNINSPRAAGNHIYQRACRCACSRIPYLCTDPRRVKRNAHHRSFFNFRSSRRIEIDLSSCNLIRWGNHNALIYSSIYPSLNSLCKVKRVAV